MEWLLDYLLLNRRLCDTSEHLTQTYERIRQSDELLDVLNQPILGGGTDLVFHLSEDLRRIEMELSSEGFSYDSILRAIHEVSGHSKT